MIYIEDQYLWSPQVARPFAEALAANPRLHLIADIPRFPDQDGRLARPPNMLGHLDQRELVCPGADGQRARVYARELRLALAREHLDHSEGDDHDLFEPAYGLYGARSISRRARLLAS